MDILLTHGYFLSEDRQERKIMKPYPPLGLLYLSAYLKAQGFEVSLFDSTFHEKSDFYRYVESEKPAVVGLYSNLMTKLNILQLIRYLKSHGITVILGGPEATFNAEDYINNGADIVVIGEGELTLAETLGCLMKDSGTGLGTVQGISFRAEDGSIIRTPPRPYVQNLDTLPLPDRDAIDLGRYIETWRTYHGTGSTSLITARGCPFHCNWCSTAVYGHSHRRRSVSNVVDEVELLLARYRPDMLWYADDVFTISHKWLFEFASEMKRRNLQTPFECISRADRVNEDVLRTLKELGCFRLWLGSESGSQRILDSMERGVTVEQIRIATKTARKYGIQTGLFVMLGYVEENIDDIEATIEHLKQTNPDAFLTTVAYPIKGTGFYKKVSLQLEQPGPWEKTPERQFSYHGRYCKTFYWFANRRIVNEIRLHQLRANNGQTGIESLRLNAKAQVAKWGMEATKHFRS